MPNYTLKSLIEIHNGSDYRHLEKGKIPVFGSGGYMTSVDQYQHDGEAILLPRKGTLDNIMYINGKFWTVDTMYWATVNSDLADPYYLYCLLKILDFSGVYTGSTLPSMTSSAYYGIKVILPDLTIQKRISDLIFSIDSKIALNNKINSELEKLAKTLYDYWFVQFDFPDEFGRPYKSSGGKMVYNEELKREIPIGWDAQNVKSCISHVNTGLNPRDNFILNNGSIHYITVKNLTIQGFLDLSNCDTIDDDARELVHRRSDIRKGDILFASIAPLGRCYLIRENPADWDINESVFSIRPKKQIFTEYLYMFFRSQSFIRKAENSSTGSVFAGIRIKTLESMLLLRPSDKTLTAFQKHLSPILQQQHALEKENSTLRNLRDFLLPMLMNGQVSVKS